MIKYAPAIQYTPSEELQYTPSEKLAEWIGLDLPSLRGCMPCNRVALKINTADISLTCHFKHKPQGVAAWLELDLPPYCSEVELIAEPMKPLYVNTKCFSLDEEVSAPCISEIQQQWVVVEMDGKRKLVPV